MEIVGYNNNNRTVTVQAGRHDTDEAIKEYAEKFCNSQVNLLGMNQGNNGSFTSINYNNGYAITTNIRRWYYTYQCIAKEPVATESNPSLKSNLSFCIDSCLDDKNNHRFNDSDSFRNCLNTCN